MLNLRRSLRGVLVAGRHVSQLRGATSILPCATDLAPPSATAWGPFSSSSSYPGALTIPSRSFSQVPSQEHSDTPNMRQNTKFYRPKKVKDSVQEATKNSNNLMRLQANPEDAEMALEVFSAIQSSGGLGLSKDVANMLVSAFTNAQKFDRALLVLKLSIKRKILLMTPPYENLMTACYKAGKFDTVVKVFALHCDVKHTPSNVMFTTALLSAHKLGKSELVPKILEEMLTVNASGTGDIESHASRAFQVALGAAVKSRQHELMLTLMECSKALDVVLSSEHYHIVLKSYAAVGDMQAALGIRDTLQTNGFDLTDDGMHWLVHCASKADQWDLVEGLLGSSSANDDSDEEVVAPLNAFNAAIAAYGNKERWGRVVDVYGIMPASTRAELKGWHLGTVIMGHAKAASKEVKLRALEIFNEHREKANGFTYGGAITALLETEQFDAALALAEDMKAKEIAWGKSVYQAVTLALIRRGTTEEAVQLLEESVHCLGDSPTGYMHVIQFYTDRHPSQDANEA
ncbi:hypothetical protein PC121_g18083 [Phytophthora cactorum]|nr:hypothetical protein PC120_g17677 [Phytophthora cactorum]KAG3051006.1 hypothetical protein PC121_g18083 [Phytophthora cactorum]KAG4046649.1 hypothetical protein PC123_g17974 [Phytophthora cactorum]